VSLIILFSCQKNINDNAANTRGGGGGSDISPKDFKSFVELDLVGSNANSVRVDANLVNG
jgi:hypothetical protein